MDIPESVLEQLELVYVEDKDFLIKRRKRGKGFSYTLGNRPLKDKKQLERIAGLAIPPAWRKVRIGHDPNGHLQAVGWDGKNRKQYRYHPLWSQIRNRTKFQKAASIGEALRSISGKGDGGLALRGWRREKVLALVIKLVAETRIRFGNQEYVKRNGSYGLGT